MEEKRVAGRPTAMTQPSHALAVEPPPVIEPDDGNIELAITAMTFAVYGMLAGLVLARAAARRTTSAP